MDLSTEIAGVPLKIPIYNASGPRCTTLEELFLLDNSNSAAILTKSTTLSSRVGNKMPRYWSDGSDSINSTGLANLGYKKYIEFSKKEWNKPFIISVAGLSLNDNLTIIREANDYVENTIELNLSCPNVSGKSEVAYDFAEMDECLRKIFEINSVPIGVKLPPYPNNFFWDGAADVINDYPISFVTCVNSVGHCLIINKLSNTPIICPNKGHGGFGGTSIKPIALANVRKMRERLKGSINVIGCGGVKTGRDVYEHILCGADAVQVGTAFMEEGVKIFKRLEDELVTEMGQNGVTKLSDFKGKI